MFTRLGWVIDEEVTWRGELRVHMLMRKKKKF